jgi:L-ascorbate metabolism protein UlaG (beta-lactamase superfamily)
MVITYYGGEFFKLAVGDIVIGTNPPGKDSKWKGSKFGADIGLVTLHDPDFSGAENLSYGERAPLVIDGPGEYEAKEIFIKGFATDTTYHGEKRINTVYSVLFENMNIAFLGALGSPAALTNDLKEKLGGVEILFVPIGGGDVLSPADAYKVAVGLEPNIIIPMHYDAEGKSKELEIFLKESGASASAEEKLTIKKKDLMGKEGDVVVLKPVS